MATNILMVRDGTVTLGPTAAGVSVECQITAATITATPDPKELTTLCGKVTVPGVTAFVLDLEYAQDWTTDAGISWFLMENDGVEIDFEVTPSADAAPSAIGKAYAVPGDFGGAAGEIAVGSVSLGIIGKPTVTYSAAPVATRGAPAAKTPAVA